MRETAGGVVLGPDGKVALVFQNNNSWSLPKGGVEEGETRLEAAVREIVEETGIRELANMGELGSYERYSIGKDGVGENREWGSKRITFFLFRTAQREFMTFDPEGEVTGARWATIAEALEMLTHPKDREFLASVRGRIESV